MSTAKLSPRQKMINVMYLILTALLALNVSKEVLNAFQIVGNGINTSNLALQNRNMEMYDTFNNIAEKDTTKEILELYSLTLDTRHQTDETLAYIDALQKQLKEKSGTKEVDGDIVFKTPDDQDTGTKLLTLEKEGVVKGEELRLRLLELRSQYLNIIDQGNRTIKGTDKYKDYKTQYASILPLEELPAMMIGQGKEEKTWHDFNFYQVPVIATDVILSKLKNDIIATEAQILQFLKDQMSIEIPDFDQLRAAVIAPKSYLANGHVYESDIFIAANSSKQNVEVFVGKIDHNQFRNLEDAFLFSNNESLPFIGDFQELAVVNGKAKFETVASGVGMKSYEGVIRMKKPNGGYEIYPFQSDFEVAPPSGVSVAPTKMNVLYIGVDNPVSITVGGTKSDADVFASIGQGSLVKQGNGKYIARVTSQGKTNVKVQAKINDQMQTFSPMEFRVKRIPNPTITLCGNIKGGSVSKNQLIACGGVVALLENFDFDVNYKVKSYTVRLSSNSQGVKSNKNKSASFDNASKGLINQAKSGDVFSIDNVEVIDPANEKRKLTESLTLELR